MSHSRTSPSPAAADGAIPRALPEVDSLGPGRDATGPRVTVAHDYLTQRGGAERVALALLKAFPGAPLVTSVYEPETTFPEFAAYDVRTSWLQRLPVGRRDPRLLLPLLPAAWNGLRADDCDVVVASTTGFAHGISTGARKIAYCHNPPRWLYQRDDYVLGLSRPARLGLTALGPYLRRSDRRAAATVDRYVANSTSVAARIRSAYGIDAPVVFPPVMIDPDAEHEAVPGIEPGFFLTVSRRRGYKNTAIACQAVEAVPGARLVVVGGLPPHPEDRSWSAAIVGVDEVSEAALRWLYANCGALVAPAFEDFGLTPVEAAVFGKPTVALRAGGYLDTVVEGRTGTFADAPTPASFAAAIEDLHRAGLQTHAIRDHGQSFGLARFIDQMRQQVTEVLQAR
jgi:glycosyltransferase involved in cell wall biosynthesis